PSRNSGFTTHTSLRWPVPIHGSLVMSTSPGRRPSAPIAARKWRTVAGRVAMNEGMLPVFWARAPPRASVSTQRKSLASFDSVENDVRTMALAASPTTEITRVHSTSRVTASSRVGVAIALGLRAEGDDQVAARGHPRGRARPDDEGRALLL